MFYKLAEDLTEEEREKFTRIFYEEYWEFEGDDLDTPCPWGCPWYFGSKIELYGSNLKDAVEIYYNNSLEEIAFHINDNNKHK